MSNLVKTVEIELDRLRNLKYDMNAVCSFEDATGKSFSDIDGEKMDFRMIRALLWAGLRHEDKEITQEYVGSYVDLSNMGNVSDKIMEAINRAMPEPEENPTKAEAQKDSNGSSSGVSAESV